MMPPRLLDWRWPPNACRPGLADFYRCLPPPSGFAGPSGVARVFACSSSHLARFCSNRGLPPMGQTVSEFFLRDPSVLTSPELLSPPLAKWPTSCHEAPTELTQDRC